MKEQFISEAIEPVADTFDASGMAVGEPGLPLKFSWRGHTFHIVKVIRTWKDTGPCTHGSNEQYVRKHWYEIETSSGAVMKLYFDRHPRGGRNAARWWLFSIREQ